MHKHRNVGGTHTCKTQLLTPPFSKPYDTRISWLIEWGSRVTKNRNCNNNHHYHHHNNNNDDDDFSHIIPVNLVSWDRGTGRVTVSLDEGVSMLTTANRF